jgi:hypothetical protein
MTATVRCTNIACGRVSHLGGDPLGRIFRCPACLAKLPTAPASAGDSMWTAVLKDRRRRVQGLAVEPRTDLHWLQSASAVDVLDRGSLNLESGEVFIGPADWDRAELAHQEPCASLVPDDSSEVFIEPFSTDDRPRSELTSTTTASMAVLLADRLAHEAVGTTLIKNDEKQFGRFWIRNILGEGKHATVFRAYDPILERDVALKVPRAGVPKTMRALERFLREARSLAQLQHPRIVPVHEAGCAGDLYYIAMALIDGCSLADRLVEGVFVPEQATEIVADLADALAYAHNLGIVHRDVKPANVRLDRRGAVYLMDFGIAYRPDSGELPLPPGKLLGTPAYMAPEQATGGQPAALPASDQYSLGSVFYEMLCGRPPFCGPPSYVIFRTIHHPPPSPHAVVPKIPRALSAICLKALAKNPERRYCDCREFASDLRRWLQGQRPLAYRRSWKNLGN